MLLFFQHFVRNSLFARWRYNFNFAAEVSLKRKQIGRYMQTRIMNSDQKLEVIYKREEEKVMYDRKHVF